MLGVSVSVGGLVALISVSHGMRTSLDSYMVASGAQLIVMSRNAGDLAFSKVGQKEIDDIAAIDGVSAISRANFTMLSFPKLAKHHKKIPMMLCFGRFPGEYYMGRYTDMLAAGGRLPVKEHEILVGANVARDVGMKVGDTLPLFHTTHLGVTEYEVVGLYESPISWENGGLIVHGDIIRVETGKEDTYPLLFVYTNDKSLDRVQKAIDDRYEHLAAISPSEFTNRFAPQMEMMDDFISLITIIAMVVGILGVLNTMMMSVAERTREIGMLRALGWSRRLIVKMIVAEGVLLSVIGGFIGLGIGVAGTELLIALFPGGWLDALYLPSTFVYGATVALVVGVLAALYPAVRAANLKPVEALRYE